jgi:transposase
MMSNPPANATAHDACSCFSNVPHATAPPPGEYAAYVGLDWGDQRHAVALRARGAKAPPEELLLEHSAEKLHGWLEELGNRFGRQPVALAVEASKGAVVAALLEHPWLVIYPIHPATSRRFSSAFTPSRAKDDAPDARTLLELLEHHRARLRPMAPQEEATRRVALLVEARRKMVDRRTLLTNQLKSLLKNYYPQALLMAGENLAAPLALEFLERWPELAVLQQSRPQTLRAFYYKNRVRSEELIQERLVLQQNARALTTDRALCEVSILQLRALLAEVRALNTHIARMDQEIASAFAAHPDAELFAELPGAGKAMAPRLCVLFGLDRRRWASAAELQKYYGIAPVTEKSGKQRYIHWRWNAPVFARQSLVEWAGQSVRACAWAKAYYLQQKQRQKAHSAILRSLAFKWLRILWRCWMDKKPYDDTLYLKQLQQRNAPLLAFLPSE